MAGVFASRGDIARAREQLVAAQGRDRSDAKIRVALEALDAMPELERELRTHPRDPNAITQLGSVCYLTAQFLRARELATEALRMSPGYQPALDLIDRLRALER